MNIEKRNEKIRKQSKDDDIKNTKTGKLKWEGMKSGFEMSEIE